MNLEIKLLDLDITKKTASWLTILSINNWRLFYAEWSRTGNLVWVTFCGYRIV